MLKFSEASVTELCQRYYPLRVLRDPSREPDVKWSFDVKNEALRNFVRALKESFEVRVGTRSTFTTSEEFLLDDATSVQVSYLAPWIAIDFESTKGVPTRDDVRARICKLADECGYTVLSAEQLVQPVAWFKDGEVTVWDCVFQPENNVAAPVGISGDKELKLCR